MTIGVADADAERRCRIGSAVARGGLEVVEQAEDAGALLANGAAFDAAVLAADRLGPAELASIALVREAVQGGGVVAVAASLGRRSIRDAVEAGVDGVVLEERLDDCLPLAVRAACVGQLSLPRDWQTHVSPLALSTRQKQVLGMVVLGFTNAQIARKLHIEESTVKSHLSAAFTKLGAKSRNEATALILDPENGFGTGILTISGHEGEDTDR